MHLFCSLISPIMASTANFSGICDLRHMKKPSVSWCIECDEGFCSDCGEHHNLAKASRHHNTMPIAEYQKLPEDVLQIPKSCTMHDEKFLLYCKDHETPCCGKCVIEGHKGCSDVVNLDDIIKDAKNSTAVQDAEEALTEILHNIKEIHKVYSKNIATLSENRKQIEQQIQEIRLKLNNHIDQIQMRLVDEIREVESSENKKICQLVETLEKKENHLTQYQNKIVNIKDHASDFQTFMSIEQIEQDLAKEEEFTQSCVEDDKITNRVITFSIDKIIEMIMTIVQKLGDIVVKVKPTDVMLRRNKKKQAQIITLKIQAESFNCITARLQQTIQTSSGNVRGCCILPDGRMAFTSFGENLLIVIKADGSRDFEINLPGAVDVVKLTTDETLVVSSCSIGTNKTGLSVINLEERKITKFIPVESPCYGLTESNGNLIFCTESELKMCNLKTEFITTIATVDLSIFPYVSTNGKHIYYTSLSHCSLICCDFQGTLKWEQTVNFPLGVSVLDNGHVYVLSHDSVELFSPCGSESRTLLTVSDGLCEAQAMHYDKTRNMLLVSNSEYKAFLYSMDRNCRRK